MTTSAKPRTARVFFALWPDERCASRLSAVAEDCAARLGGKATPKDALHLTLAFVGAVNEDRLSELMALANATARSMSDAPADCLGRHAIVLDRLDGWPEKRILWAGSDCLPLHTSALAKHLAESLVAADYLPAGQTFVAHVTLVRQLQRPPRAEDINRLRNSPLRWVYRDFVLMRSWPGADGPAYERLGSWRLGAG